MAQFLKFCFVGGISFAIDYSVLIFLTEVFEISYVVSNCISFSISVIFNYLMSMHFVFSSRSNSKINDFTIFIVLSAIGLIINEALLVFGVSALDINYILIKLLATVIVMIFNFLSRKIVYER